LSENTNVSKTFAPLNCLPIILKALMKRAGFLLPNVFTFTAAEAADEYGDEDHPSDHRDGNDESLEIHCDSIQHRIDVIIPVHNLYSKTGSICRRLNFP